MDSTERDLMQAGESYDAIRSAINGRYNARLRQVNATMTAADTAYREARQVSRAIADREREQASAAYQAEVERIFTREPL